MQRWWMALVAPLAGGILGSVAPRTAVAQVNLPPPPPPPLATEQPSQPPPPQQPAQQQPEQRGRSRPAQHGRPRQQERAPEPASTRGDDRSDDYRSSDRRFSLRFNPLPLFLARLSMDFEIQLAPHHALVLSPHLGFKRDRLEQSRLAYYALGYTYPTSTSIGAEVGYHYWLQPRLEGLFLGPSLVVGVNSTPRIDSYQYYGLAFDVGYQVIVGSGFTLLVGGGVLAISAGAGNTAHLTPRLLLGLGWTF